MLILIKKHPLLTPTNPGFRFTWKMDVEMGREREREFYKRYRYRVI